MKTIAIVGHTSMLGKRLTEFFAMQNVRVITCGRNIESNIVIDIASGIKTALRGELCVDSLIHCAAGFYDDTWEGCRKNDTINALGAYWILELAERLHCPHIIYAGTVSSMADFDSNGMSSYAFSKAQGEDILEWGITRNNGSFTSLRFPQIYDEFGDCCRHQQWFGRIVAYAAAGKNLHLPKSMGPRNFIHVSDAAQLLCAAFRKNISGRLNIAHPESLSYSQIASMAYSVFNAGGIIKEAEHKTPFRKVNFPGGEHAVAALDYSPAISMLDGLSMIKKLDTQDNFGPMDVE